MSKRGNPVKHIGFAKAAAEASESYGEDMERGKAAVAAGARKASKAAKKRNPRLARVFGKKK